MADPSSYRPAPGTIPTQPGVYRFSDEHGQVIYVGKAKNLRNRLNSYFQDISALHPRTQRMVTTAAHVQWTVVQNEVESLQSDSPSVGRRSMLKVFPDVQDSINAQLDAQQPAAGNDRGRIHAWQHSD